MTAVATTGPLATGPLAEVLREVTRTLPRESIITDRAALRTYECDGLTHYRSTPALVVIPDTADRKVYGNVSISSGVFSKSTSVPP